MADRGDVGDKFLVARLASLGVAFEVVFEELQEGRAVFIADPDDGALGLLVGGRMDRQQQPLRSLWSLAVGGYALKRVKLEREGLICCLQHQDDAQGLQFFERQ